MISLVIFSLFFVVNNYFIKNIQKKYQIILYISVFLGSIIESVFFGQTFQHQLITKDISFIIPFFSMAFLSYVLGKKEDGNTEQKLFILFILFSFIWDQMAFFSLYWLLYISDSKNEKIFVLISIFLLGASSLFEDKIIYVLLVGFVFLCARQNSVEDYAIKNYILYLILDKIGNVFVSNIVISLVLLRSVFILIQATRCRVFLEFSRNFFSCAILIGIVFEILTEAKIFSNFLLSIVLLKTFLNSVVKRYFLVSSKNILPLVNIREMLGNKNITLVFIFLMIVAPFNPIFNGITFYLSQVLLVDIRVFFVSLCFLILILLAVYKMRIFIEDAEILKNELSDFYQFLILSIPLVLSISLFLKQVLLNRTSDNSIGYNYFQYFFALSLIYFLLVVFSIYFRKKIDQWIIMEDSQLFSKIQVLDEFLKKTYTAVYSSIARCLHLLQVSCAQIINISYKNILLEYDNKRMPKFKGEHGINPSIEMGILFIILLAVTLYYGNNV